MLERLGIQPARVLWALVALTAAGPIGAALADRSTPVVALTVIGAWLGWAVGFGALLVMRSSALTVVRLIVPAGLSAVASAVLIDGGDGVGGVDGAGVLAVAVATLACVAVFMPWVGEAFVDGSSYGNEQRLLLRAPVVFWLVAPLTWALVVAGAVAGPLLLAAKLWVPGGLLTVVGWIIARFGVRSLHQLTRRWLVLVPTGLVLHDHLTMPEAQLFARITITGIGPAPADVGDAHDLTAGAPGMALRLTVSEPVELLVRTGWGRSETVEADAVLFCPSRPRRFLDAAGRRRIPVG